jgi:hypothetical protein
MAEELSSRKPGEAMSRPVAKGAARRPFVLRTNRKTEPKSRRVEAVVSRRGPRIAGEKCFKMTVSRETYRGGWSLQTSV